MHKIVLGIYYKKMKMYKSANLYPVNIIVTGRK